MKPPRIIIYGPPGSGKTGFAMTGGAKVKYLDIDGGVRTGLFMKDKWSEQRKLCFANVTDCTEPSAKQAVAFRKVKAIVESYADTKEAQKDKPILVIDSLTTLLEYCMRYVLDTNGILNKNPRQSDWGQRDTEIKQLLINLKSVDACIILLAHELSEEIDGTNVVNPAMTGQKLPPFILSQFDEILYARIMRTEGNKMEHIIWSTPTSSLRLRSRSCLPPQYSMNDGLLPFLAQMDFKP
jgi:hypothetical protein